MNFRKGQEVACVTDEGWENMCGDRTTGPAKGDVLTITEVWHCCDVTWLIFAEWGEDGFDATAFRPLARRPPSIEVFENILRDATREVEAI